MFLVASSGPGICRNLPYDQKWEDLVGDVIRTLVSRNAKYQVRGTHVLCHWQVPRNHPGILLVASLTGIQYSCLCLWPISVAALANILHNRGRSCDSAMVRMVQGFRLRCLVVLRFWLMPVLNQVVDGSPGFFWHRLETSILRSFVLESWW